MMISSRTMRIYSWKRCRSSIFVRNASSVSKNNTNEKKTVLVLGSSGALGSCIVKRLANNFHVLGADIVPPSKDDGTFDFIPIPRISSKSSLQTALNEDNQNNKFDAIICANGGFAMDNFHDNVAAEMMQVNYEPVIDAANLLPKFIAPQGLFVVIGAAAALEPGPGMIGYGASKAASHYVVQSLGAMSGISLQNKQKEFLPEQEYLDELTSVAICPTILDTPSNRKAMTYNPKTWIPLDDIAKQIHLWIQEPQLRPHPGSLIKASRGSNHLPPQSPTNIPTMFTLLR